SRFMLKASRPDFFCVASPVMQKPEAVQMAMGVWIILLELLTIMLLVRLCALSLGSCRAKLRKFKSFVWQCCRNGPTKNVDQHIIDKFHETQCTILTVGSGVFAIALFLRLLAVHPFLLSKQEHNLQHTLDYTNVIAYPLCLVLAFRAKGIVTPSSLGPWYIALQTLCVIPVALAEPDDVQRVSLVTLLPRVLIGQAAPTWWLPIFGNLIQLLVVIPKVLSQHDVVLTQAAELFMLITACQVMRWQVFEIVSISQRLRKCTIDMQAVSTLLLGFCDAVVEIDNSMKLTEDCRQLSTMLLHSRASECLGRDFLSFFCPEDRKHIQESLTGERFSKTVALNARMLDSLNNFLRVELLHIQFLNAQGEECWLVGMREFQDMDNSIAPLPCEAEESKACIMFDCNSMEILTVNSEIQKIQPGVIFEGMHLADLPGSDIYELLLQIQGAVNGFYETSTVRPVHVDLQILAKRYEGDLTLQEDQLLETLVGTLQLRFAGSPLTEQNLKRLAEAPATKRSKKRSRNPSSKGSRSSGSQQGSILQLRLPVSL
ncbi:unnamed protein product, partial [Effrenium voratum]